MRWFGRCSTLFPRSEPAHATLGRTDTGRSPSNSTAGHVDIACHSDATLSRTRYDVPRQKQNCRNTRGTTSRRSTTSLPDRTSNTASVIADISYRMAASASAGPSYWSDASCEPWQELPHTAVWFRIQIPTTHILIAEMLVVFLTAQINAPRVSDVP